MQPLISPDLVVTSRYFGRRLSARRIAVGTAVAAVALLAAATPAGAQAQPSAGDLPTVGQSPIAARQFIGLPKSDGVVVRSGPSESDLAVTGLRSGQEVVVVDMRGKFLRILPPADVFCLVPKARVNVSGAVDGTPQTGRVSDDLSVRVGSTLNATVGSTALRLNAGDTVRVIGEKDNYYKIEPPKLVFFYVPMAEMKKGREVHVTETAAGWNVGELPTTPSESPAIADAGESPEPQPTEAAEVPLVDAETDAETDAVTGDEEMIADEPLADAGEGEAVEPVEPAPTPAPEPEPTPAVVTAFAELDARYEEQVQKPLEEQPLDELQAAYVEIQKQATEAGDPASASLLPVIEARLKTIAIRQSALADLEAIRSMRNDVSERQEALTAEREELAQRAERGRITLYAAVGELQPSSLQIRGATLFRLCDPETKRTIVYLKASGDLAESLVGQIQQFVGIKGDVVRDPQLDLEYIDVTGAAGVNPDDVFGAVAAKLIPPSMVSAGGDAVAEPVDTAQPQPAASAQ